MFGLAYFYFAQTGYWAPGYAVRLVYDVNSPHTTSPFVEIDLSSYLGLSRADLNDVLVTDVTGNRLPFTWLDSNRILVYAKGLSGSFRLFVFLSNPDVNAPNASDLNGSYSLTVVPDAGLCTPSLFNLVMNRIGLDPYDGQFVCASDGNVAFGIAYSGDPDDGRSNRIYHFVYDGSSLTYAQAAYLGFQNYANSAFLFAYPGSQTVGGLVCPNGRTSWFNVGLSGVTTFSVLVRDHCTGRFNVGVRLDGNILRHVFTYSHSYTTGYNYSVWQSGPNGVSRVYVYHNPGWFSSASPVTPTVNNSTGVTYYIDNYVAHLWPSAVLYYPPKCGYSTAMLSDGSVALGSCRVVGTEVQLSSLLSSYAVPRARVGSCYLVGDRYSTSPYVDQNGSPCYFPVSTPDVNLLAYSVYGTAYAGLNQKLYIVPDFDPGVDYVLSYGVQNRFYQSYINVSVRFDDWNTAAYLSPSLSSIDVNDQNDPVITSLTVTPSQSTITVAVSAEDDVAVSSISVYVADTNVSETRSFLPSPSVSAIFELNHSFPPGTELNVAVTVADLSGKSTTEYRLVTVPSPPPAGGGGGAVYQPVETTTTELNAPVEEAQPSQLSAVPVEPRYLIAVFALLIVGYVIYSRLR